MGIVASRSIYLCVIFKEEAGDSCCPANVGLSAVIARSSCRAPGIPIFRNQRIMRCDGGPKGRDWPGS